MGKIIAGTQTSKSEKGTINEKYIYGNGWIYHGTSL